MTETALDRAAVRASLSKAFLAFDLARYREFEAIDRAELARRLALDQGKLARLELCRSPRRNVSFARDVEAIAAFTGTAPRTLAELVRLVDALAALAASPATEEAAALAAARDEGADVPVVEDLPPTGTLYQPTWLQQAVQAFWDGEEPSTFPRELELDAVIRLPLALVELERLRTDGLREWLRERDVPITIRTAPRPLRAALVAFAGAGVVFLAADDDEAERRVSLAHEIGHYLADYLLPRQVIARTAPALLDVVDGLRPVTRDDDVAALLARVALGVHTHLLDRGTFGQYVTEETEQSEERATRIAWELLAPQAAVIAEVGELGNEFALVRVLQTVFGLPSEPARAYARYLRRASGDDDSFERRFRFED